MEHEATLHPVGPFEELRRRGDAREAVTSLKSLHKISPEIPIFVDTFRDTLNK